MDLNSRVQKIINYSELSLSEFADEIGVQRSNISHVLSGRNKPSLDFLMKIKDRFPEIQWEWLIEGKGAMIFYLGLIMMQKYLHSKFPKLSSKSEM